MRRVWMGGVMVVAAALATGCLPTEEPTWSRGESLSLGGAWVDTEAPQAFGFQAEVDAADGVERFLRVETLAEWADWDETGAPTAVWSLLNPCPAGGEERLAEQLTPFVTEVLDSRCPLERDGRWLVVLAQDDPATIGPLGKIHVQPTVHLRASGTGKAPPEGFALGELTAVPAWHRMLLGIGGPDLPAGSERVEGEDFEVTVHTTEDVAVIAVVTTSASWDEAALEVPRLQAHLVDADGARVLGWSGPLEAERFYVASAPLVRASTGASGAGDYTLRVVAEAEAPVAVDVSVFADVQIHVFGFGDAPPDDLVFDMTPLNGGGGW